MTNTYGTRQHWLPACVIGRFGTSTKSKQDNDAHRNRIVTVRRRGANKLFQNKASKLCLKKGMYDISPETAKQYGMSIKTTIDEWDYENDMPFVINGILQGGTPDLDLFVHVLVPYVAGLFMRGQDYAERQDAIPEIQYLRNQGSISPDNTTFSRIIHLQRILSIILTAEWTFYSPTENNSNFIINDIGMCHGHDGITPCWLIPLDPKLMVIMKLRKSREIAKYGTKFNQNGEPIIHWNTLFCKRLVDKQKVDDANQALLNDSLSFCMGEELKNLTSIPFLKLKSNEYSQHLSYSLGLENYLTVGERIEHEFEWYTVSRIAAENLPPNKVHSFTWNRPYQGNYVEHWKPWMPIIPANIMLSPSGLKVRKNIMTMDLHETTPFKPLHEDNVLSENMREIQ